jgi:hypothetical protein
MSFVGPRVIAAARDELLKHLEHLSTLRHVFHVCLVYLFIQLDEVPREQGGQFTERGGVAKGRGYVAAPDDVLELVVQRPRVVWYWCGESARASV